MVFSFKANKNKIIAILVLIAIVISAIIIIPGLASDQETFMGETNEQRVEFLNSYGWTVLSEAVDARDVTIPLEFSDVYETYNDMQIAQGFDLKPHSGVMCKQYIYYVTNYPDSGKEVHATLLVFEGQIIGGDVSSSELGGFMHGFDIDSEHFGGSLPQDSTSSMPAEVSEPEESEEASDIATDTVPISSEPEYDKAGNLVE